MPSSINLVATALLVAVTRPVLSASSVAIDS
jgi:hypothetical protein